MSEGNTVVPSRALATEQEDGGDDDGGNDDGGHTLLGASSGKSTRGKKKRTQAWHEMEVPPSNPSAVNDYIDTCVDAATAETRPNAPFYADHRERVRFADTDAPAGHNGHNRVFTDTSYTKAVVDDTVDCRCAVCGHVGKSTDVEYIFCPNFPRQFVPLCKTCVSN